MLDEQGLKQIRVLKDDPCLARHKTPLEKFSSRNDLTLKSKGVTLPSDKTGKIPLDYILCISDAFKRITKGSGYSTNQKAKSPTNLRWKRG